MDRACGRLFSNVQSCSRGVGGVTSAAPEITSFVIGVLLLFGGVLKGLQLASDPLLIHHLGIRELLWIALVEIELFLAGGFLFRWNSRRFCRMGVLFFISAGTYSAYKAISGANNCGCFGMIAVSPWITLTLDVLAVVGLLLCRPLGTDISESPNSYRKSLHWASTTVLTANALFFWVASSSQGNQPLSVDQPVHNIGRVSQGSQPQFSINLANLSGQPIHVLGIRKTCSCTVAALRRRDLQPYEQSLLSVTVDTRSKRGWTSFPLVIEYIVGASPSRYSRNVELLAEIVPAYEIRPAEYSFDSRRHRVREYMLSCQEQQQVAILDAVCTSRAFHVSVLDDGMHVRVEFDPQEWSPLDRAELVIRTNNDCQPVLRQSLSVVDAVVPGQPGS